MHKKHRKRIRRLRYIRNSLQVLLKPLVKNKHRRRGAQWQAGWFGTNLDKGLWLPFAPFFQDDEMSLPHPRSNRKESKVFLEDSDSSTL